MESVLFDREVSLDSKYRITVRGAAKLPATRRFHMFCLTDGRIILEPSAKRRPAAISKRTLRMMDRAVKNYGKGVVSAPVDVDELKGLADGLPD